MSSETEEDDEEESISDWVRSCLLVLFIGLVFVVSLALLVGLIVIVGER